MRVADPATSRAQEVGDLLAKEYYGQWNRQKEIP